MDRRSAFYQFFPFAFCLPIIPHKASWRDHGAIIHTGCKFRNSLMSAAAFSRKGHIGQMEIYDFTVFKNVC